MGDVPPGGTRLAPGDTTENAPAERSKPPTDEMARVAGIPEGIEEQRGLDVDHENCGIALDADDRTTDRGGASRKVRRQGDAGTSCGATASGREHF